MLLVVAQLSSGKAGPVEEANECNARGVAAFRAGDAGRAVREFERSYGLFPNAKTLFNLARAYDRQGQRQNALRSFERFLTDLRGESELVRVELAERAEAARSRSGQLRAELSTQITGSPLTSSPPTPEGGTLRRRWWVVAAAAVVVGVVTTILVVRSRDDCRPGYDGCL